MGYAPQFKKLAGGLDILVATPGRLIDHLERQTVNLGGVETLILDEADHMLDMGFAPALKKIVAKIPKKRHTQMFSATMPDNILQLAQSLLQEPETVMVTPPAATADRVEQSLCMVGSQAEKRPLTLDLLEQQEQPGRTLIFTRTKHGANRLASFLTGKDHPASAIHGDKSQGTRERMLREFRSGETPILVATDIAARGIDVKDVQLVINYDLPEEPEVYVHRIGRTARAGAAGQAIALCSPDEIKKARDVHKLLGRLLPVHSSSATIPSELQTVPGTHRERKNSMQENRSASRRGPRKSYGIISSIIKTLCVGTVGSLACQAAMQAYADDVPSTFVEGNYSPEVARYVQSIAGVALASGIHDYDENATSSYQVLAQVLNSGNATELPDDLKRAIEMLTSYVPDPNATIQPILTKKQIERMEQMADRIENLMEEKYGVDLEDCMNIMKRALAPSIPDILRSCDMEGTQLPTTTVFRPRLGKALNEAYARLAASKLPAAGTAQ